MAFFYVIGRMKRAEYETIKHLIETGFIKDITEVVRRIQPQLWYADIGITYKTYAKRLEAPGTFKVDELMALSAALEVDPVIIFSLVAKGLQKRKGKR